MKGTRTWHGAGCPNFVVSPKNLPLSDYVVMDFDGVRKVLSKNNWGVGVNPVLFSIETGPSAPTSARPTVHHFSWDI